MVANTMWFRTWTDSNLDHANACACLHSPPSLLNSRLQPLTLRLLLLFWHKGRVSLIVTWYLLTLTIPDTVNWLPCLPDHILARNHNVRICPWRNFFVCLSNAKWWAKESLLMPYRVRVQVLSTGLKKTDLRLVSFQFPAQRGSTWPTRNCRIL